MYSEEYYDEEYYDEEPYVEVNHEFTSIFHDESVLECVFYEGRLGPDHPGSHNMRTKDDYSLDRDRQDYNAKEIRKRTGQTEYSSKDKDSKALKDRKLARELLAKEHNSALKNKYGNNGKTRYIPGSDKDKKANERLKMANKHNKFEDDYDKLAGLGSSYRKSSAYNKGDKGGISDRERKNLEEKRKKESKEIRRKEFHRLASKNEFAFLDIDMI